MKHLVMLIVFTMLTLTACQATEPETIAAEATQKKLIELSWDIPTPAFFRASLTFFFNHLVCEISHSSLFQFTVMLVA